MAILINSNLKPRSTFPIISGRDSDDLPKIVTNEAARDALPDWSLSLGVEVWCTGTARRYRLDGVGPRVWTDITSGGGIGLASIGLFGDGSSGDISLTGDITLTAPVFCRTFSTNGWRCKTAGFGIYATVSITIDAAGKIGADGQDAVGSTGGLGGDTNVPGGNGNIPSGLAPDTVGGSGNMGSGNAYGGAGGDGGGAGGGYGLGGGALNDASIMSLHEIWFASRGFSFTGTPINLSGFGIWDGGGGGGGGHGSTAGPLKMGGGGGGGGARVILCAPSIVNSGELSARGGAGAAGTGLNAGGGGGGGGGAVALFCRSFTGNTPIVTKGLGGASGGGTGVAGADGADGNYYEITIP